MYVLVPLTALLHLTHYFPSDRHGMVAIDNNEDLVFHPQLMDADKVRNIVQQSQCIITYYSAPQFDFCLIELRLVSIFHLHTLKEVRNETRKNWR